MNNFDPIDEALNIEVSKPSKIAPVKKQNHIEKEKDTDVC